jgi:hypothetical protein
MATRIPKPISKLKRAVNLDAYFTVLRVSVPGVRQRARPIPALAFFHRPNPKSKPALTKPQPKPAVPRRDPSRLLTR